MNDQIESQDQGDSVADAIAAISLVAIFIATCVFWISGH